jgi:hypothetical protein
MTCIVQKLEKHFFSLIKNSIEINIYNHVPDNSDYPFIKIGNFSLKPWLLLPNSWIIEMRIDCFSNASSNLEAINIFNSISKLVNAKLRRIEQYQIVKQNLDEWNISQTHNNIWHWELNLTLWVVEVKSIN